MKLEQDRFSKIEFAYSLKNVSPAIIVPNGSNLPFQICFDSLVGKLNHAVVNQTENLLKKFIESWEKKLTYNIKPLYDALDKIRYEEAVT